MIIIACGGAKIATPQPVQARELYTGSLFKACWRTAITLDADVRIFSAFYGLLWPNDMVRTYDFKMDAKRAAWFRECYEFDFEPGCLIHHLLPAQYADALPHGYLAHRLIPAGLTIGRMMAAVVALQGMTLRCQLQPNGQRRYPVGMARVRVEPCH